MTRTLYARHPAQERWLAGGLLVLAALTRLAMHGGALAWEPDPVTLAVGVAGAFLASGALAVWLRR